MLNYVIKCPLLMYNSNNSGVKQCILFWILGIKKNEWGREGKRGSWPRGFSVPDRVVFEGEVVEVTFHVVDGAIFVEEGRVFFGVAGIDAKHYGSVGGCGGSDRRRRRKTEVRIGIVVLSGKSMGRWKRQHRHQYCPHFKRGLESTVTICNCNTL